MRHRSCTVSVLVFFENFQIVEVVNKTLQINGLLCVFSQLKVVKTIIRCLEQCISIFIDLGNTILLIVISLQAAFALYNYMVGYVMFYDVRSPQQASQDHIAAALSILWTVSLPFK